MKYTFNTIPRFTVLTVGFLLCITHPAFSATSTSFSQKILSPKPFITFIDATDTPIKNPSITVPRISRSADVQHEQFVLGDEDQKIRIVNLIANSIWNVSIAATDGPRALWTNGNNYYDYNDTYTNGQDDTDLDGVGGYLLVDPSSALVEGIPNNELCPNGGLQKNTPSTFQEKGKLISSITLITGQALLEANCQWDVTGIELEQIIPAEQADGHYKIGLTLTII